MSIAFPDQPFFGRIATAAEFPRGTSLAISSLRALNDLNVEDAEIDVVAGAQTWLLPSNHFVIEVHDRSYLAALQKSFGDRGIRLNQIDQRALPFVGHENRKRDNCWLVSELSPVAQ